MNIKKITEELASHKHPDFTPGDTISVHIRIKEGEKERTQIFEGIVLRKKSRGNSSSFTVRKISFGVGVERIFPYSCANIEKIEVVKRGRVRRAKLFYIRELQGKALRIQDEIKEISTDDSSGSSEETSSAKSTKTSKKDEALESASVN